MSVPIDLGIYPVCCNRHVTEADLLSTRPPTSLLEVWLPHGAPVRRIAASVPPGSQCDTLTDDPWIMAAAIAEAHRGAGDPDSMSASSIDSQRVLEWLFKHEPELRVECIKIKIAHAEAHLDRLRQGLARWKRVLGDSNEEATP